MSAYDLMLAALSAEQTHDLAEDFAAQGIDARNVVH